MHEKEISAAVIKRLPKYYRHLGELMEKEVVRISSKELSERMNVTASQIRQDLNNFGGFGQQGYGYNVENLYLEIAKILGMDRRNSIVIIGAGNLGQALANYPDFKRRGFYVCGIFDVSPQKIGKTINGVTVQPMEQAKEFIQRNEISIAVLTIPKENAPKVAAELVQYGIQAIWNFAPTDLHLPAEVVSENVHLAESLMRLSFKLRNAQEGGRASDKGEDEIETE